MHIGVCKLKLQFSGCHSLKDKRRILRSLIARLKNQFHNIVIAETDHQDSWQLAEVGVATISNDPRVCESICSSVLDFIQTEIRADFRLLDSQQKTINFK